MMGRRRSWRLICTDEGSSVVFVLMREIVACGQLKREDLSAAGWKVVLSAVLRWLREEQLRGRIVEKGKVGFVGSRVEMQRSRKCGGAVQMQLLFWLGSEVCPAEGRRNRNQGGGRRFSSFLAKWGVIGCFGKDGFVGIGFFCVFFNVSKLPSFYVCCRD